MKIWFAVVFSVMAAVALLAAGCSGSVKSEITGAQVAELAEQQAGSNQLAKNFYEFDQKAYENALKEGKYVFLNFHADWCAICRSEAPNIRAAFNELNDDRVIGFLVNYNDGRTSGDERDLAKKFNIPYQHTKIVVSPEEALLSRNYQGPSSKQDVLNQIKDSIASAR